MSTVNVAGVLVAVPHALEKTARNLLPFWPAVDVNDSVVAVAPPMLLNVAPPSVDNCHCTVCPALLFAAAVNVTVPPAQTVCVTGFVDTTGSVSTRNVAAVVLVDPHASVKTARYWFPFWALVVENESVADVAPPMLLKVDPPSVETCHWTVWSLALLVAVDVNVAVLPAHTV